MIIERERLSERIFKVISLFSDRKIASEIAGKSEDMLWAYTKGRNSPSFEALARLALAKGINLNWLATGEGSMYLDADTEKGRENKEILKDINKGNWPPLIPTVMKARIISTIIGYENRSIEYRLKHVANAVLDQYLEDLPLFLTGILTIPEHEATEEEIENLRKNPYRPSEPA